MSEEMAKEDQEKVKHVDWLIKLEKHEKTDRRIREILVLSFILLVIQPVLYKLTIYSPRFFFIYSHFIPVGMLALLVVFILYRGALRIECPHCNELLRNLKKDTKFCEFCGGRLRD